MTTYPSLDAYYRENPGGRQNSPEADYGVHWTMPGERTRQRVSYVMNTGEIYAASPNGPVTVLATFPPDPGAGPMDVWYKNLDRHLDGWASRCARPGGMNWLIQRLNESPGEIEVSHLFGNAGPNGHETALCGARDGRQYLARELEESRKRRISCERCTELDAENHHQNWEFEYRAITREDDEFLVCRFCGKLERDHDPGGWLGTPRDPGIAATWTCRECGLRGYDPVTLMRV